MDVQYQVALGLPGKSMFKTESTRTLNNFDFQRTKTLYHNNLKHIAFFLSFFKGYWCKKSSVVTRKKNSHGRPRKWMSNFTELHPVHMQFSEFYLCNHNYCEIWHSFSQLPWEIFFGVPTDDLLHLKPLKNVKKNAIFFKLFWYKVFVLWKLKLLNFLMDSVLNIDFPVVRTDGRTVGVRLLDYHIF